MLRGGKPETTDNRLKRLLLVGSRKTSTLDGSRWKRERISTSQHRIGSSAATEPKLLNGRLCRSFHDPEFRYSNNQDKQKGFARHHKESIRFSLPDHHNRAEFDLVRSRIFGSSSIVEQHDDWASLSSVSRPAVPTLKWHSDQSSVDGSTARCRVRSIGCSDSGTRTDSSRSSWW